jgi:hypothetical protein
MKIIVHNEWGIFEVPKEVQELIDCDEYNDSREIRTDLRFINWLEKHNYYEDEFKIIEVPDNTTDFAIADYDGMETLYYVVDGKIYEV